MDTKIQATAAAKLLLERMKSPGWSTEVWENLGWHYALYNKKRHLRINVSHDGTFFCHIQPSYSFWCAPSNYFKDPNKAVNAALKYARDVINGYCDILVSAETIFHR